MLDVFLPATRRGSESILGQSSARSTAHAFWKFKSIRLWLHPRRSCLVLELYCFLDQLVAKALLGSAWRLTQLRGAFSAPAAPRQHPSGPRAYPGMRVLRLRQLLSAARTRPRHRHPPAHLQLARSIG